MTPSAVLISSTSPPALPDRLAQLLPELETIACRPWDLPAHLRRAGTLVVDGAIVDEPMLRLAAGLRLVQVLGPSTGNVDLQACGRRGIYVASVPWGTPASGPDFARLVEGGEPPSELAASTLARVVAGNVRRLLRGQAPLFWINPPNWMDPDQALCGRAAFAPA